jgi:hypothetical protein
MYPSRELRSLALRRGSLQQRIQDRREQCVDAGRGVERGVLKWARWGRLAGAGGILGTVGIRLLRGRPRGSRSNSGRGAPLSFGARALLWAPIALRVVRLVAGG